MKNTALLLLTAVTVAMFGVTAAWASSSPAEDATEAVVTHGTEVPFPFGTEIPFPWSSIEGTWEVRDRELDAYFSFRVQRDEEGTKILKVTHIDKVTRRTFGEGAGFVNEDQKVVRAVMRASDFNYMILVRVFRDTKAVTQARTATVLTIRYFGEGNPNEFREQHYILRKISKQPIGIR